MQRKFRLIIGGVLVCTGILGYVLLGQSAPKTDSDSSNEAFYPITQYRIVSVIKELNQADIDEVVKPYLGQSFWQIPLAQLQSELTRLDWVFKSEVRRVWPDTLLIRVQEQKPVVRWKAHGLLNSQGDLFYPKNIEPFENLVILQGSELRTRDLLKTLEQLQQALSVNGWVIRQLNEQPDGVWSIETAQGLVLWLDPQDWQHKIKRWLVAYEQVSKETRNVAQEIDLRYSNGFVVKQKTTQVSVSK